MTEIQQANLLVVHGVLDHIDELDLRMHHRSLMESAGLRRIMGLCREFGYPQIETQLGLIDKLIEADEQALRDVFDQDYLKDYTNPQDVFNAIISRTQGSKALSYFLSTMQHLLLIREDGPALSHYFQLIDSTVTDIVMDRKLNGVESKLGTSVQRIIAQLNEADRYQFVEEQANEARARALQLKLEKETLEEELSKGSDGLVGQLKTLNAELEGKLKSSRGTVDLLQGRIEEQKRGYEEQIAQLESQILELFRMLKELGKGFDEIVDKGQGMDRKELMATLEKQLQRNNTISLLEGRRDSVRKNKVDRMDALTEDGRVNGAKSSSLKRSSKGLGRGKPHVNAGRDGDIRDSQFADADEASVQEHIEQRIAAGTQLVIISYVESQMHLLIIRSIHRETGLYQVREMPEAHLDAVSILGFLWMRITQVKCIPARMAAYYPVTTRNKGSAETRMSLLTRRTQRVNDVNPARADSRRIRKIRKLLL